MTGTTTRWLTPGTMGKRCSLGCSHIDGCWPWLTPSPNNHCWAKRGGSQVESSWVATGSYAKWFMYQAMEMMQNIISSRYSGIPYGLHGNISGKIPCGKYDDTQFSVYQLGYDWQFVMERSTHTINQRTPSGRHGPSFPWAMLNKHFEGIRKRWSSYKRKMLPPRIPAC